MCDTSRDNAKGPPGFLDHEGSRVWNDGGEYTVDDYYIDRAIDLAWIGAGKTQPNPLVGAVVVKDGEIVGVGYHPRYGEDHAETIALERAGASARGSTLYATLEPCAHFGNTPPCVNHVIKYDVGRVVIATCDPDDRVNGRGVRMLRERGIRVDVGNRAERAMLVNMAYFKTKLGLGPAVTLKVAVTLDGKIASAPGRRDEITGHDSRKMVHRLRAVHDAVLVGIETILTDSPRLDCRFLDGVKPPVPVVLDSDLRFPNSHTWLAERGAVIVTSAGSSGERENALVRCGARVIRCRGEGTSIAVGEALGRLHGEGVSSVLVEGGGKVFSSFVDAGMWDGMFVFVSPVLFGPGAVGLADRVLERERLGAIYAGASFHTGDILLCFINERTRRALGEKLLQER